MAKLKIAILEDNFLLLSDLKQIILDNKLGDVIIAETRSDVFLECVDRTLPDVLFLDIDLSGDSMSGIDVASRLNLPTLFITGKSRDFLDQIETLKINKDVPIEFLTKPVIGEKLLRLFKKFEVMIEAFSKNNIQPLKLKVLNDRIGVIDQQKILFIQSVNGSKSNNKYIQLSDDEIPYEVSHFSLEKFFEMGLSKELFVQTSQSFIVNKSILSTLKLKRDVAIYLHDYDIRGKKQKVKLEITEKYWSNLKRG